MTPFEGLEVVLCVVSSGRGEGSECALDPDPGHVGQEDGNRPDTSLLLLGKCFATTCSMSTTDHYAVEKFLQEI